MLELDADGELVLAIPTLAHQIDVRGSHLVTATSMLGAVDYGGGWLLGNDGSDRDIFVALFEIP